MSSFKISCVDVCAQKHCLCFSHTFTPSGLNSLPASSLTPEGCNLVLSYIRVHAFPLLKGCRSSVIVYLLYCRKDRSLSTWATHTCPILLSRKCWQLFSCSSFSQQLGKQWAKLMVYFNLPLDCRYNLAGPSQRPRCVTLSGFGEKTLFLPTLTVFRKCLWQTAAVSAVMVVSLSVRADHKNHRTIEQPRLEGTSEDHLIQLFMGKRAQVRLFSTLPNSIS